jgi:threonine/homoserine/homoserine lactone efflux protein
MIPAEVAGYLVAILAIGYLIGPAVSRVPSLSIILRLFVAGYLVFVAIRLWRCDVAGLKAHRLIGLRDVFVTTLLNPKALLFALSIVPLHAANGAVYLVGFSLMVMTIGAGWIAIGIAIRRGLLSNADTPFVPRIGAAVITAFAGYLAIAPFL